MAQVLRNEPPGALDLQTAINALKPHTRRQSGVATLVAGTVTVTGVTLTSFSKIDVCVRNPGGTMGFLSAPSASRNVGTGQFVINSSSGTDTSTVEWEIYDDYPHWDKFEYSVTAATAVDLPTSLALVNQMRAVCVLAWPDTLAHKAADTTTFTNGVAVDLASAIALANEIKADHNTHIASTTIHYVADGVNNVATANASDQTTLNALANALKTAINAHLAAGMLAASVRVVPA